MMEVGLVVMEEVGRVVMGKSFSCFVLLNLRYGNIIVGVACSRKKRGGKLQRTLLTAFSGGGIGGGDGGGGGS